MHPVLWGLLLEFLRNNSASSPRAGESDYVNRKWLVGWEDSWGLGGTTTGWAPGQAGGNLPAPLVDVAKGGIASIISVFFKPMETFDIF